MSSTFSLAMRSIRKSLWVQLTVAVLFAATTLILMLYGSYLQRERFFLNLEFLGALPQDHVIVQLPEIGAVPTELPLYRVNKEPPVRFVTAWREETLPTERGKLPFAVLTMGSLLGISREPGVAYFPESLAREMGVEDDQPLWTEGLGILWVQGFHQGLFVGERIVTRIPGSEATGMLFEVTGRLSDALDYLGRVFPGSTHLHREGASPQATAIVKGLYSPGVWAQAQLLVFLALAFFTVTLYRFMTGRKPLAVIKALGLRVKELVALIALEDAFAPVLGLVLGTVGSFIVVSILSRGGEGLVLTPRVLLTTAISMMPVLCVGLALPCKSTQVASVNELLYERPIALYRNKVNSLNRVEPALQPLIEHGVVFVRLGLEDGSFRGYIFRQLRDWVKVGEVLALAERHGGMVVTEYVAPVSGQIVQIKPYPGLIGIAGPNYDHKYFADDLHKYKRAPGELSPR